MAIFSIPDAPIPHDPAWMTLCLAPAKRRLGVAQASVPDRSSRTTSHYRPPSHFLTCRKNRRRLGA